MRSKRSNNKTFSSMFNELAYRNVKKSAKNYYIYFFTLMLSVCLFYSFNSVSTQFASLGLEDRLNYLSFSSSMLTAFSLIVCCIMGALVVYANRFLLKRRKKEMGIYATLGMERSDLNRLLMKETLRIGVLSLAAGLVLGVFAAQILSLLTAKLAGISLASYHFMISFKAIVLSILFFGVVFFFVHLFNVKELKKMSLVEMIYADRKNETVQGGNAAVGLLTAVLAAVCILGGYAVIFFMANKSVFKALGIGGLLVIVGTIFFFSSALRVKTLVMKKRKGSYYKGLNIFTVSQFSTRIKSEGRSGAMVAILLFLSLSLTILGPGLGKLVMNGIENADPYDGTIFYARPETGEFSSDPMETLSAAGFQIDKVSNAYEAVYVYEIPSLTDEVFGKGGQNTPLTVLGVEDYNRLLKLQGKEAVALGEEEFIITYAFPPIEQSVKAFEKDPRLLTVGDRKLRLAEQGVYKQAWENRNVLVDEGTIIIPQYLADNLTPKMWVLNFNFMQDAKVGNELLYDQWYGTITDGFQLLAADEIKVSITSDNLLTTYLGLYLGITFLITSGAVLALQQLSQSADNVKRYELLRKMGASQRDMRRSLTKQLRTHFGLPILLAVTHAAVIVALVFRYFEGLSIYTMAVIAGAGTMLVTAVYLLYFITTYLGSRRILKL